MLPDWTEGSVPLGSARYHAANLNSFIIRVTQMTKHVGRVDRMTGIDRALRV